MKVLETLKLKYLKLLQSKATFEAEIDTGAKN
jgi:hypothetical protein